MGGDCRPQDERIDEHRGEVAQGEGLETLEGPYGYVVGDGRPKVEG